MDNIENYREKETKNLTFMRVILTVIIVFYHSILAWGDNFTFLNVTSSSKFLYYLQQFTTTYHTRCFTIISGYLFFYLKHEKGKYQKFLPFVFNKFKRLIVPYLFVGIVFVVPLSAYAKKVTYLDNLKVLLFIESLDQLWFLIMLFLEFVIFYLLDKFIEKYNILSFIIAFALLGLGYFLRSKGFKYGEIDATFMYFLFFLVGYKYRQLGTKKLYDIPWFVYVLIQVFMLTLYICFKEIGYFSEHSLYADVTNAIMFIVNGPIAFILLQKISNKINYENKLFNFVKDKAFTMYLFHQQFIYLFVLLTIGMKCAELNALIVFLLTFVATSIVTLIMHTNEVTRFLVGCK